MIMLQEQGKGGAREHMSAPSRARISAAVVRDESKEVRVSGVIRRI